MIVPKIIQIYILNERDPVPSAQDAGRSCIIGGTSLILPLPTHTAVSQPLNKKKLKRPVKSIPPADDILSGQSGKPAHRQTRRKFILL